MSETVTDSVTLDWYDGPLLEIARVEFERESEPLIQVTSLCDVTQDEVPPTLPLRASLSGTEPWTRTVVRLSRSDLQAMLDMLDGKPICDWRGDMQDTKAAVTP